MQEELGPGSEFDRLLILLLEGELSATDREKLDELLRTDAAARQAYARYLAMHAALQMKFVSPPVLLPNKGTKQRTKATVKRSWLRFALPLAAAALAVAIVPLFIYVAMSRGWLHRVDRNNPIVEQPRPPAPIVQEEPPANERPQHVGAAQRAIADDRPVNIRPAAWLVHTRDCRWTDPASSPQAGDGLLPGQSLRLESGAAEVEWACGAKLLMQGKTGFVVESGNTAYQQYGQVAVCADTPSAHGFTVRTPTTTLVDEGTEFCVDVTSGRSTELQVFRGSLNSQATDATGKAAGQVRFVQGNAVRFDGTGSDPKPVPFKPELFPRLTSWCDDFESPLTDKRWIWDDPHHHNSFSLSTRPGFLRMSLRENEDAWTDDGKGNRIGRGGAPFIYTTVPPGATDFTMETCVDIGTAHGGRARSNSIGGLLVYDAAQGQYGLTLGIEEIAGHLRISMQSPGVTHCWSWVERPIAHLRLRRDGTRWTGYYKTDQTGPWILLGSVREASLSGGQIRETRIGLFAKTWTRGEHPGGTGIDFDFLRVTWEVPQQTAEAKEQAALPNHISTRNHVSQSN
jgi:hypothetical protein